MSSTWREWLTVQATASSMKVEQIPLDQVSGWGFQQDGEVFGRPDGKFFQLIGTRVGVPKDGQREVPSWDQPLLRETSGDGAVVVVLGNIGHGTYDVLVQARIEPGNASRGCVLLGPTLQSSRSNLGRAHGGKRPPRSELLDDHEVTWYRLPCDGGRFLGKFNQYAIINLTAGEMMMANSNEHWMNMTEINEAICEGLVNEHLMKVLALASAIHNTTL